MASHLPPTLLLTLSSPSFRSPPPPSLLDTFPYCYPLCLRLVSDAQSLPVAAGLREGYLACGPTRAVSLLNTRHTHRQTAQPANVHASRLCYKHVSRSTCDDVIVGLFTSLVLPLRSHPPWQQVLAEALLDLPSAVVCRLLQCSSDECIKYEPCVCSNFCKTKHFTVGRV